MPQQFVDAQAIIAHLSMALGLLDDLGAHISAAHVDAALQSFREEARQQLSFSAVFDDPKLNFSHLEALIDQICDTAAVPIKQSLQ